VRQIEGLIRSLLSDHGRVILHGHYVGSSHQALEAAKGLDGVAVIHTEHSKGGMVRELVQTRGQKFESDFWVRSLGKQYKDILEYSRKLVFPSAGALELFEEAVGQLQPHVRRKVLILHSGVSAKVQTSSSPARSEKRSKLFAVAAHVPEKGVDRMLRAVAKCRDRGIELSLRIAGCESVCTQDLMRLREELELTQKVPVRLSLCLTSRCWRRWQLESQF
jgi:glycosyltransferase involved in cell wall biosynthesis